MGRRIRTQSCQDAGFVPRLGAMRISWMLLLVSSSRFTRLRLTIRLLPVECVYRRQRPHTQRVRTVSSRAVGSRSAVGSLLGPSQGGDQGVADQRGDDGKPVVARGAGDTGAWIGRLAGALCSLLEVL